MFVIIVCLYNRYNCIYNIIERVCCEHTYCVTVWCKLCPLYWMSEYTLTGDVCLSVFTNPGKYTVVTKFSHQENKHFPKFQLHILSPLEVICQQSQMGAGQDKAPVLAAALAYLVQCDVAGKNDTSAEVVDVALVDVLQSVSKVPVLSLPGFLCGESHTCILRF